MKALVVSDKQVDDVKLMMKFYFGFTPDHICSVSHYHELTQDQRVQDNTLIHVKQQPIPLSENYPLDTYFEMLGESPYNQPKDWIKSFNYAVVSTIDDKSERRYQMLHS